MNETKSTKISEIEFIVLLALLMSNVALSIDALLPALSSIGNTLNVEETSSLQYLISMIFLGLGIGQLFFGSLSDSYGRKPTVFIGVTFFLMGSLICVFSKSLAFMLYGRVLQGFGLAAPKTTSISIIRDTYSGDKMARVMSFITVIFIIVPTIAPLLGQLIFNFFNWQAIFYFQLFFVLATIIWFFFRQEETLPKSKRKRFNRTNFQQSILSFLANRSAVYCTLISAFIEGAFIAYLSNSKQLFQDQYGLIEEFPFIFGGISLVLGLATFLNGYLVMKYGMRKLIAVALMTFLSSAVCFLVIFQNTDHPAIHFLLLFLTVQFLSMGFIFGNVSALAMEKLGHIAGVGASVFTFTSTTLGVLIAIGIGNNFSDSVTPLFWGFVITGAASLLLFFMTTKNKHSR